MFMRQMTRALFIAIPILGLALLLAAAPTLACDGTTKSDTQASSNATGK